MEFLEQKHLLQMSHHLYYCVNLNQPIREGHVTCHQTPCGRYSIKDRFDDIIFLFSSKFHRERRLVSFFFYIDNIREGSKMADIFLFILLMMSVCRQCMYRVYIMQFRLYLVYLRVYNVYIQSVHSAYVKCILECTLGCTCVHSVCQSV